MKLAIYTIIYTTSWKNPPDPGVYPTVPKNIPTDQKYQLQLHHEEGQRIYDNTARMDKALNNQVIQSVEDRYLKELKNKQIGFLGVMWHHMLENILDSYGNIMTTDLKAKNQQMNELINILLPIDKYFK